MDEFSKITESSLFDIYSKNFSYIKRHGYVNPDLDDVFICPLCFRIFSRSDISAKGEQEPLVTIEHLPPKSLGGRPQTLTCKKCNNYAGRELDSNLLNFLLLLDFLEKKQGASVDSIIESNGKKIRAKLESSGESNYRLSYPGNRNRPKDLEEFQENYSQSMKISFTGEYQKFVRKNRPDWSLLRIAYLWAFSIFGYGFVMTDSNLKIVREQINNPGEEVLKHWAYESNINLSDQFLGINLITAPAELQSFLVVFDLITPYSKRRHGVLLPGPTEPGINIYEALEKAPDRRSDISIQNIPQDREYLTNPELCMMSNLYWSDLKKP